MKAVDVFTLEALNAQQGDCLLLHYGSAADPKHILIDGGPTGVYKNALAPRLAQLKKPASAAPVKLEHVFVTHLDDDHIHGVLDLANAIDKAADKKDAPATCTSFWLNTFKDTLPHLPPTTLDAKKTVDVASLDDSRAALASVKQGQDLRDAVTVMLKATLNGGSQEPLMADKKGVVLDIAPELKVTLVCPSKQHLEDLAADWRKKAKPTAAQTSAYVDRSVYNLSSLVMVVEAVGPKGKPAKMLLTGDARGDHILAGLKVAKFLDAKGTMHVDIFKVAHHGSDRNFTAEFFQHVTADHYVISANGRDENPSEPLLEWIAQGAKGLEDGYTLWMTNEKNPGYEALAKNVAGALKAQPTLKPHLKFRDANALSLKVELFGPIKP